MVNSMVRVRGVFRMSTPGPWQREGGLVRGAAVCWTGPGGQWDLLDLLDASDAAELRCLKPCRMRETFSTLR